MQEYYSSFYKTLVLNVATISAIVVAVVTFAIKAFNENNGAEVLRNYTLTVLNFIEKIVAKNVPIDDTPVPVVKVAQKRLRKS
jgi:hypothetical protein